MTDRTPGPPPTPFTRYLLIVLSYGVAGYQATRGHWFEVAGLAGLGTGLVLLRLATSPRPSGGGARRGLRYAAWACFAVTAAAVLYVIERDYR